MVRSALKSTDSSPNYDINRQLKEVDFELEKIQIKDMNNSCCDADWDRMIRLTAIHHNLSKDIDYIKWARSREKWLKEGEKNTKFFHNSIRAMRNNNAIISLKRDDGVWTHNKNEIIQLFQDHLSHNWCIPMTERDMDTRDIAREQIRQLLPHLVIEEDNGRLLQMRRKYGISSRSSLEVNALVPTIFLSNFFRTTGVSLNRRSTLQ